MKRGTLKTSAIVIATGGRTEVYRTLEEIPAPLRKKLVRSTGGANAGTVLIADRRGAQELLRAHNELSRQAERRPGVLARVGRPLARFWMEFLLSGVLGLLLWMWLVFR